MKEHHQGSPKGDFQILGEILFVFIWKQMGFNVPFGEYHVFPQRISWGSLVFI